VGHRRCIAGAANRAAAAQSSHFETNRNPVLTALGEDIPLSTRAVKDEDYALE
jgi:hypothetical protein